MENQILDRDETFVLSNHRKSTTIEKMLVPLVVHEPTSEICWLDF